MAYGGPGTYVLCQSQLCVGLAQIVQAKFDSVQSADSNKQQSTLIPVVTDGGHGDAMEEGYRILLLAGTQHPWDPLLIFFV